MSCFTTAATALVLFGLVIMTSTQTVLEQLLKGYPYFVSNTTHTRIETPGLCAASRMHDDLSDRQFARLHSLCRENSHTTPHFQRTYWMTRTEETATNVNLITYTALNLDSGCDLHAINVPGYTMLYVMCVIVPDEFYNATTPPPAGNVTVVPGAQVTSIGGHTDRTSPTSGFVLIQVTMITLFLTMYQVGGARISDS